VNGYTTSKRREKRILFAFYGSHVAYAAAVACIFELWLVRWLMLVHLRADVFYTKVEKGCGRLAQGGKKISAL
jgi:hypothetical protein